MKKMIWPPEKTVKYEFNSLDREFVEIRAENGSERPNKSRKSTEKRESR